jgi:trans-AT polyketide synthase/acyltransferase/oxidoreductase domain-containing protein
VNTQTNASAAFDQIPTHSSGSTRLGGWTADASDISAGQYTLAGAIAAIDKPVYVIDSNGTEIYSTSGQATLGTSQTGENPLIAWIPPLRMTDLGDAGFCRDHGIRLPYMTGAMANGIASTRLVRAIAQAGMLGSFGAAGLMVNQIEAAILELKAALGDTPFCANLIHSPNEKGQEQAVVDVYLRHGIHLVEASAYMALTLQVVRYRLHGIHRDAAGTIVTPNRIIAKASRQEVATRWFSPPPAKFVNELLAQGIISAEQAELATQIPMAQDLTVEADSGGHTDNRPALTLLPTMLELRDKLQTQYNYAVPLRVGAAGGIATPATAAAAFAIGAAYIVTGSVNQACIESGSSDLVRQMLATADQADVAMAPAVDMFEMGVKLQVLKRGTMFPMRSNKLYELYRAYGSIEQIPQSERESLEKTIFKAPIETIWQQTREFFNERNPAEIARADKEPKHKMALLFRWYLGLSSRWANAGVAERQVDYQIWCGPAMGAFNEWTRGTTLEQPANRNVANVALNLMYGAALVTRINQLRMQGVRAAASVAVKPLESSAIMRYLP